MKPVILKTHNKNTKIIGKFVSCEIKNKVLIIKANIDKEFLEDIGVIKKETNEECIEFLENIKASYTVGEQKTITDIQEKLQKIKEGNQCFLT